MELHASHLPRPSESTGTVPFEHPMRLLEPTVDFLLFPRPVPTAALAGIEALARGACIARYVECAEVSTIASRVAALIPDPADMHGRPLGAPMGPFLDLLARDCVELVDHHRIVTGANRWKLTLAVTDDDECRRFHVDVMALRGIVTYCGPGTQILRAAGATGEVSPGEIIQADSGAIVWLKGSKMGTIATRHRSPPLEGTGRRRVVLKVNEVSERNTP